MPPLVVSSVVSKQVSLAMNKFETSNGFGPDKISSDFLKIAISILAEPLSQVFNLSSSVRIFLDQWKIARIAPIYKHGNFIHFIFTYLGTVAPSVRGNCFSGGRGNTFTNRKIDTTK